MSPHLPRTTTLLYKVPLCEFKIGAPFSKADIKSVLSHTTLSAYMFRGCPSVVCTRGIQANVSMSVRHVLCALLSVHIHTCARQDCPPLLHHPRGPGPLDAVFYTDAHTLSYKLNYTCTEWMAS